jgi:radical SAM protein with 4Fe4S-binding SPASM domain
MCEDMFKNIMLKIGGIVPEISLHFAGEPMLHPKLHDLIDVARASGVRVIIHTNATLLTEEISHRIIEAGLHTLVISFDALTPSQYETMRVGANYDKTLGNIRSYLEVKKRISRRNLWGKALPFTTIKVMRFHADGSHKLSIPNEFRQLFKGLPVDRFYTEWAHGWAGEFAESLVRENKFPVQSVTCRQPCHILWKGFAIGWDGTAYACCNDLRGEYTLGHIGMQSLEEIWNGEPMVNLRATMVEEKYDNIALCKHCTVQTGDYTAKRFLTSVGALTAKAIFWYEPRR